MKKPKPNLETLLMREACDELDYFTRRYNDWMQGKYKKQPHPDELFWSLVKYSNAWDTYRIGYAKNPPF